MDSSPQSSFTSSKSESGFFDCKSLSLSLNTNNNGTLNGNNNYYKGLFSLPSNSSIVNGNLECDSIAECEATDLTPTATSSRSLSRLPKSNTFDQATGENKEWKRRPRLQHLRNTSQPLWMSNDELNLHSKDQREVLSTPPPWWSSLESEEEGSFYRWDQLDVVGKKGVGAKRKRSFLRQILFGDR
ncbi:hypothetical protein Ddc_17192 [Ditylenchus destructor]|nr:hypothetical protein Ddc_17192 [Ditylenchus destructor]